jgi:hypothetical protein
MNVLQDSTGGMEELDGTWMAGTPVTSCQLWPPSVVLYSFGCPVETALCTLVQRKPIWGFDGANVTLAAPAGGFGRTFQSPWAVAREIVAVAVAVGERGAVAEGCPLACEVVQAARATSTIERMPHTALRLYLPCCKNVILPVAFLLVAQPGAHFTPVLIVLNAGVTLREAERHVNLLTHVPPWASALLAGVRSPREPSCGLWAGELRHAHFPLVEKRGRDGEERTGRRVRP